MGDDFSYIMSDWLPIFEEIMFENFDKFLKKIKDYNV